jgi:hypothetical protein
MPKIEELISQQLGLDPIRINTKGIEEPLREF